MIAATIRWCCRNHETFLDNACTIGLVNLIAFTMADMIRCHALSLPQPIHYISFMSFLSFIPNKPQEDKQEDKHFWRHWSIIQYYLWKFYSIKLAFNVPQILSLHELKSLVWVMTIYENSKFKCFTRLPYLNKHLALLCRFVGYIWVVSIYNLL